MGRLRSWIDPRLNDSFPVDGAKKVSRLAVMCLDANPSGRLVMTHAAGKISKIFLISKNWSEKINANKTMLTSTFGDR